MRPKYDHKIIRPGEKRYDIYAKTDLAKKFEAIRKEQAAAAKNSAAIEAEARAKVAPIAARGGKRR